MPTPYPLHGLLTHSIPTPYPLHGGAGSGHGVGTEWVRSGDGVGMEWVRSPRSGHGLRGVRKDPWGSVNYTIFYFLYLSVVSLAGQYFVYFYRICYYFCVARELQTCSTSATIYEPGAPSTLPLDGAAFLLFFTLLVTAILHC
jgi:hypothetical protein